MRMRADNLSVAPGGLAEDVLTFFWRPEPEKAELETRDCPRCGEPFVFRVRRYPNGGKRSNSQPRFCLRCLKR